MNFFESQDRARKSTTRLVMLFLLAVLTLIVMTNLLLLAVLGYSGARNTSVQGSIVSQFDWTTFIAVGAGVSLIVLAGSLYKILALSAGGKVVAESLGGQLVPRNTADLNQRKLLNIVEEMAIASGTAVPPVYVLGDEPGINAFAAGFSPGDAVIGITRGAIEQLNREQLQGVIAHEFSHILNGDMRLNIRLMGVLHGILIIGIIGYYILRSFSHSRGRRSGNSGGAAMVLGLGLMVIGYAGTFFGNMIKASVSRQREFLADASAVQFTRNPQGIAGALKKIGGFSQGSRLANPAAPEASHAFFAEGVSNFLRSLLATHPPLEDRIRNIEPNWDGKFDIRVQDSATQKSEEISKINDTSSQDLAGKVPAAVIGAAVADTLAAIDTMGNPDKETINYARTLISTLPAIVKEAAQEPYGARALIYTLLLHRKKEIRAKQLQQLLNNGDTNVYNLSVKLAPEIDALDSRYRLPLIDMALPSLKQLSLDQYKLFKHNLSALIKMDTKVDLFEWSLQTILLRHLEAEYSRRPAIQKHYTRLSQVKGSCEILLSLLVHAAHSQEKDIQQAFKIATNALGIADIKLLPKNSISLPAVNKALEKLNRLKPLTKPRLLKACATCIASDQRISATEVELLRAFSDALDCPMPPLKSFI